MENLIKEDVSILLDNVKRYLHSQQELYGNDIYINYHPRKSAAAPVEQKREQLKKFYYEIKDCQKCALARHRTRLVFGSGNPNSTIMLIGEAPGFHEDREGKPFVGKAGQLLDKILKAIGLSRDDVFITNIVKCRPPQNRDPQPDEWQACNFMLKRQIEIIKPEFILILGRIASHVILERDDPIGRLRGQIYDVFNARAVVTYHPAALLRNPGLKRSTWEDVQLFQKLYQ